MTTAPEKSHTATLILFSFTLFLSAALMFGLQPMVGKMLLPIVGGTPSGWIVAMAFFQVMLLAGYFLAHALSRFDPRKQALFYMACLGVGLFFLPSNLAAHTGLIGETPMAFDTFKLLTAVVAVPFIALSATAATIQRLFTTTGHKSASDPYFLYAASNLGSFAGLLLYPFLVEPRLTLTQQAHGWLCGYAVLIGLTAVCLLLSKNKTPIKKEAEKPYVPVPQTKRIEWVLLAFLPSALLLAVTTHITMDILSVPLLWVIPLSIYLLTFVAAFSRESIIRYDWLLKIQPIAAAVSIGYTLLVSGPFSITWYALGAHLISFTLVALMCHMRLARVRPVEDPRHLTDFYLMLAIGGALGGILVAFVVPLIFDQLVEYPFLLIASALLNEDIRKRLSRLHIQIFITGIILAGATLLMHERGSLTDVEQNIFIITIFVLLTVHPKALVTTGSLAAVGIYFYTCLHPMILTTRNFYGIIRVYDQLVRLGPQVVANMRFMQNGTTLHGTQIMEKEYETTPTTYYTEEGPLGDVMSVFKPKTIASVGLGSGTTNCFSRSDRKITFFDINPDVVKIATEKFTYLSKCGAGMPRIVLGDARLELKKLENEKFDLIILDAFSSDNIPTHLLTKEAIEVYLDRLTPKGVILFHISNRHFTLDGPIAAAGRDLGLKNALVMQGKVRHPYAATSRWMLLTRPDVDIQPLAKYEWVQATAHEGFLAWTDDYTNLLSVMNF
jgi:spermidine synthase